MAKAARGDIDYLGQLDDDMADMADMIAERFPGERRLLIGHSSGGAFTLRIAGGKYAGKFDRYIALSPFLGNHSPTTRPHSGGWASFSMPRILGLDALNNLGVRAFNHLPTLAFAVTPGDAELTASYSFNLMSNFGLPYRRWEETIAAIHQPTTVLVAGDDEMFIANQFAPTLARLNSRIEVRTLPGVTHMGLVLQPAALAALLQATETAMH